MLELLPHWNSNALYFLMYQNSNISESLNVLELQMHRNFQHIRSFDAQEFPTYWNFQALEFWYIGISDIIISNLSEFLMHQTSDISVLF